MPVADRDVRFVKKWMVRKVMILDVFVYVFGSPVQDRQHLVTVAVDAEMRQTLAELRLLAS